MQFAVISMNGWSVPKNLIVFILSTKSCTRNLKVKNKINYARHRDTFYIINDIKLWWLSDARMSQNWVNPARAFQSTAADDQFAVLDRLQVKLWRPTEDFLWGRKSQQRGARPCLRTNITKYAPVPTVVIYWWVLWSHKWGEKFQLKTIRSLVKRSQQTN